jgi:hypothetical protein
MENSMLPLPSENVTDKEFLQSVFYMLNAYHSLPRAWQTAMALRLERLANPREVDFSCAPVQLELPFVNS